VKLLLLTLLTLLYFPWASAKIIGSENIIIEGSRQLRELEQLQDEIPSLDMALKFTDRPLTNVNLSVDEWKVVKFVDPKNTMRQIAKTNKLT
jgi:hypothetical protein